MQFITSLFGGEGNSLLTAVFALGIVIVLIVLGVWLLKLVFNTSGNLVRGRNRRLSVVDSLALDPKRQLLIIRRDNVEHLILTGGAHDIVVETGIHVDEATMAQPSRRPVPVVASRRPAAPRPAPAAEEAPAPATAISRLRDLGRPANTGAKPKSLRHTGLMRPVPAVDSPVHHPENSDRADHDSAKEVEGHSQAESTEFDEQHGDTRQDDRKADGF